MFGWGNGRQARFKCGNLLNPKLLLNVNYICGKRILCAIKPLHGYLEVENLRDIDFNFHCIKH